jgi:hypothetical protein
MRRAGRRPRGPMAQNAKFNFPTGRHISAGRRLEVSKDKRGSQSQISVNICASSPPCCFLRVHRLTLNASINCLPLHDPAKDTFHCGLSPQVLKGLRHLIGKKEAPCTGRWQAGDFKLLISPTGTLCSPQKPNVVDRHVLDILSAKKTAGPDIDDRRRNRCRCRHGHRRCLAVAYGDGVTLCYRCDGGCVCNCRSCNPRGPRHGIIVELKQHFLLKASLTDLSLPLHDTEAAAFCSQALPINCLFAKPVLHKRAPLHLDGCARASRHNFPFLQKRLEAFEKLLSTTNEDRAL